MIKTTSYRLYIGNDYEDHDDGYHALICAKAFAPTYGPTRVAEKHGKRWLTIATFDTNGNMVCSGKKKDYYVLPVDSYYHQPTGMIETVPMYKAEAIFLQRVHGFVFDDYVSACYRADD